jgi:tetratricopeptide (TPR) repeat protein
VLSLQPNNDDAHRRRGVILARQGQVEQAIAEYQQAIGIRPDYWRNHNALGGLYYRTGRFAEAAIAYQKVVDLQPDSADGLMNLGAALHAAGDTPRAIEYYGRSIDVAATDSAYSNLGTIYYSQRRFDEAIAAFEAAIRLSPSKPLYHRNLGDAHHQQGHATEAAAAYERAIRLATGTLSVNPKDADMLSLIALCEAKLGRYADARRRAAAALQLAPDNGAVVFRAASVAALAGRADDALDLLERAVARGFSRAFARDSDDFAPMREHERFVRVTTPPR